MSVMKKLRIILIVIVFCLVMINILKNNIVWISFKQYRSSCG
jgi:hypothetical protein